MIGCTVALVIIIALFTLPNWGGSYINLLVRLMCMYIVLGQMWNLLSGYAGLVSLGQQMYIGLGAYTVAVAAENFGIPFIPALLLGGVVSMIVSIGISYLLLRMRGMYFSIATWIFAEAMMLVLSSMAYFGRGQGLFILTARPIQSQIFYYAAALFVITVVVVVLVLRSKLGLGLFAIRDDDNASATCGVPQFKSKLYCMMIASFVTGICGGVFYMDMVWVQPVAAFSINWTVASVFIVVIGGIGTVMGPVIGGVLYVFLSQYLASLANIGSLNMVILGVIAVAVILLAPNGIVGTLERKFGFEILSTRRRHSDLSHIHIKE
jgi:branched-chain amino acid transport system permease protein